MAHLFSGIVNTNNSWELLSKYTNFNLVEGKTYTIQILNSGYLRKGTIGEGFYYSNTTPFEFKMGSEDVYIKTSWISCIFSIEGESVVPIVEPSEQPTETPTPEPTEAPTEAPIDKNAYPENAINNTRINISDLENAVIYTAGSNLVDGSEILGDPNEDGLRDALIITPLFPKDFQITLSIESSPENIDGYEEVYKIVGYYPLTSTFIGQIKNEGDYPIYLTHNSATGNVEAFAYNGSEVEDPIVYLMPEEEIMP